MGHLETGYYEPVVRERVYVWPEADADGDGDQVWEDVTGPNGEPMGRREVKDGQGRPVKHYEVPEDFRNFPSAEPGSNGSRDNYVLTDAKGRIWRHPTTGEACHITPGAAVVVKPNGDFVHLKDEYSQYLYSRSHEKSDAPDDDSLVDGPDAAEKAQWEKDEEDRAAFEEFKRNRQAETEATLARESAKQPEE